MGADKAMADVENKSFAGIAKSVGDRQIRVIVSTADPDREGDIIDPNGIDFSAYNANPVVLFNHDHDHPIARCVEIGVKNGRVEALVQFPEEGSSPKSDEIYALVKQGVLNAVSIGFIPKKAEPVEGSKFGRKFTRCECLEFSVVSIPANSNALIIERSLSQEIEMTDAPAPVAKSLYDVCRLSSLLAELDWLHTCMRDDEEWEGEQNPATPEVANAIGVLVGALKLLVEHETSEMPTAGTPEEGENAPMDDAGEVESKSQTDECATEAPIGQAEEKATTTEDGIVIEKAGRVLSASNHEKLKTARESLDAVISEHEASLPTEEEGCGPKVEEEACGTAIEEEGCKPKKSFDQDRRRREIELLVMTA